MRNFMLAATAIVGITGLTAGAFAQTAETLPLSTPVLSGLKNVDGKFPPVLAPGTFTVRLSARVVTEIGYGSDSGQIGKGTNGKQNGNKDGGFYFGNSVRIYPGADGKLANGLEYGGAIEIRQNSGGTTGSTANTLYVRRSSVYVGTPTVGRVIVGQIDGAVSQFINTGAIETFDYTGTSNGSVSFVNAKTAINWPFWENGNAYVNNKIVYISPKLAGFDLAASFEPTRTTGNTNCDQASPTGCPTQSSIVGTSAIRRNTYEVAARYQGSFGPVAASAEVGYIGSGFVKTQSATFAANTNYRGLSVYDAGLNLTAFGFTVGGHYVGGDMNSDYNLIQKGQKRLNTFLLGGAYAWSDFSVGVNYFNGLSAGTFNPATNKNMLHEIAYGAGGKWNWAPGSSAYVSAVYMTRSQAGVDLLNGGVGNFNHSTQARMVVVGNVFRW
jgi:hypothetical protein